MNHCHAIFDKEDQDPAIVESRKWVSMMLDFSTVEGMDELELSLKAVNKKAGEKEQLEFDLIEVPLYRNDKGDVTHHQSFLGFYVGTRKAEGTATQKTSQTTPKMGNLQLKREEKKRQREEKKRRQHGMKMETETG